MKKLLTLLTAAMMLLAFASCGTSGDTASGSSTPSDTGISSVPSAGGNSGDTTSGTGDIVFAPRENGLGNTFLEGLKIEDQNNDGVIHIGCIGDSITAGNPGKCYPDYLQEYLNELSKTDGKTYVVHNNGKGGAGVGHREEEVGDPNWGWGTVIDENDDGKAYFYYDDKAYRAAFDYVHDVTIVQMGTNDFGATNRDEYFADDYYNYLVKPFQDMGSQVIISTPPYAEQEMYDTINGAVHDEVVTMARDLNLPLVDMNRLMWGTDEIYDGIHPFPAGYSVMALIFYEHVFGGTPSRVTVKAEPGSKVTFIDSQARSYNRDVGESGEVLMVLSPAETTYSVVVECDGFLTYRDTVTVGGEYTLEPDQKASSNVALSGTAFDNGIEVYQGNSGPNEAKNVIDGILDNGGWQPKNYNKGDYVGLDFDKAYGVGTINIYWETAAYISSFDKNGYELWLKVDGKWKQMKAADVKATRESYTGDIVCDIFTLDPAVQAEGVKVVILDGDISDHKFAPKLYELEVFSAGE